jgi:hypothetical protein
VHLQKQPHLTAQEVRSEIHAGSHLSKTQINGTNTCLIPWLTLSKCRPKDAGMAVPYPFPTNSSAMTQIKNSGIGSKTEGSSQPTVTATPSSKTP